MFPSPFLDTTWARVSHPLLTEIANELAQQEIDCIATPNFPGLWWLLRNHPNIDVIHFHWPEQYYDNSYDFRLVFRVARRLRMRRLTTLLGLMWLRMFTLLARWCKIPVVWTLHDLYPHGQTPLEHDPIHQSARRFLMTHIGALILNCRSVEPMVIQEFGAPKHIFAAPLGDYRKFYPDTVSDTEARRSIGLRPENIVFLFFGNARRQRNPLKLIEAFRSIHGEHLRLILIGECEGTLRSEIEHIVFGDWRIHCHLSRLPNEQVEYVFKACDFAVMPGHFYLTSAVVRLSLSYGRPVIVPQYGCAPEMIGPAGICYDDNEPNGLKNALLAAIQADRHEYRSLANKQARSMMWSQVAINYRQAYMASLKEICNK